MKRAVFADDEARNRKGYIPRDAAEKLLGRSMDGTQWLTRDESAAMRAHSEWSDAEPIGGPLTVGTEMLNTPPPRIFLDPESRAEGE